MSFVRLLSASTFAQLHFAPSGSVLLGRSTWPLEPSRPRCALDQAEPNENEPTRTSQACPNTLRRGHGCLLHSEPTRLRWGDRIGRSSPLGRSTGQSRTKTNRTRQAKLTRRLELAPEPQQARKVPLEPTAMRCVRFSRSKSAVFCSSLIGINFCSAPLCSVGLGFAEAFQLAARVEDSKWY